MSTFNKSNPPLPTMEELEQEEQPQKAPERKRKYDETEDPEQEGSTVRVMYQVGDKEKFWKRFPIQLQGLSSEMLPPMTKRKFATYESVGRGEIDPLTDQMIETPSLVLPGKYVIYDPFDENVLNRYKTLKNVTRHENVTRGGVSLAEEVIDDIIFDNGLKKVAIEKSYLIYAMLELHPLNESNRWRDKSQAPAFRRIDIELRKWDHSSKNMDLALAAENAVVAMKSPDEIIRYAHSAGIPTKGRQIDTREGSVKYDLRIYARKNPKDFFCLNPNNPMAIEIAVLDAIDLGLIDYIPDSRKWHFTTDGSFIGQHLPDQEPQDALVKLLTKPEYKKVYERLNMQLNYWN
jgi:hypothetical protein